MLGRPMPGSLDSVSVWLTNFNNGVEFLWRYHMNPVEGFVFRRTSKPSPTFRRTCPPLSASVNTLFSAEAMSSCPAAPSIINRKSHRAACPIPSLLRAALWRVVPFFIVSSRPERTGCFFRAVFARRLAEWRDLLVSCFSLASRSLVTGRWSPLPFPRAPVNIHPSGAGSNSRLGAAHAGAPSLRARFFARHAFCVPDGVAGVGLGVPSVLAVLVCHPDRSGPIFSCAPNYGALGRGMEGSLRSPRGSDIHFRHTSTPKNKNSPNSLFLSCSPPACPPQLQRRRATVVTPCLLIADI